MISIKTPDDENAEEMDCSTSAPVEILIVVNNSPSYDKLEQIYSTTEGKRKQLWYHDGVFLQTISSQRHMDEALRITKKRGKNLLKLWVSDAIKEQPQNYVSEVDYITDAIAKMSRTSNATTATSATNDHRSYVLKKSGLLSGKVLRYKMWNVIGKGSSGKVYLITDNYGTPYAVKKIKKDRRSLPEAEFENLKKLNHERIVQFIAKHEPPELQEVHIFMEYINDNLKDYLAREMLSIDYVIEYTKQIAEGLRYLHGKGIVHKDLKPSNILLALKKSNKFGMIKLADFGSSWFGAGQGKGGTMGTPKYQAPEVSRGVFSDPRSDIWSFGVVVIEMCQGIYPWDVDGKPLVLIPQILTEPPNIYVSGEEYDEIIELAKSMLHVDVNRRPTADDILNHGALIIDEHQSDDDYDFA